MLVKILERVRELYPTCSKELSIYQPLDFFFNGFTGEMTIEALENFCKLDDTDILFAVKKWAAFPDKILSILCTSLLNRKLYKTRLQTKPFDEKEIIIAEKEIMTKYDIEMKNLHYFVFSGETANTTYTPEHERILIIFKNGIVKNIADIDNPLIHQTLSMPVKKFYICQLK